MIARPNLKTQKGSVLGRSALATRRVRFYYPRKPFIRRLPHARPGVCCRFRWTSGLQPRVCAPGDCRKPTSRDTAKDHRRVSHGWLRWLRSMRRLGVNLYSTPWGMGAASEAERSHSVAKVARRRRCMRGPEVSSPARWWCSGPDERTFGH
jgi:hypothetical protein